MFPVPKKPLKLVISRCCFAEDGKEMYQINMYNARAVIVLLILLCDVLVAVAPR